jgi:DEAD/DEAH box helicase domain-containing protein
VIPVEVEYYTDAESKVTIKILHSDQEEGIGSGINKGMGDVSVTRVVVRYKKVRFHTHENLGWGRVSLPEQELHTGAFWVSFPEDIARQIGVSVERLAGAMYGASHILREIVPIWILSDPSDIRAYSLIKSPFTDLPTIYIYETTPGGVGFSRRIYDMFDEIVDGGIKLLKKCGCKDGCPSCVGPVLEVGEAGKSGAEAILRLLRRR